jgi:hypothetical protein
MDLIGLERNGDFEHENRTDWDWVVRVVMRCPELTAIIALWESMPVKCRQEVFRRIAAFGNLGQ